MLHIWVNWYRESMVLDVIIFTLHARFLDFKFCKWWRKFECVKSFETLLWNFYKSLVCLYNYTVINMGLIHLNSYLCIWKTALSCTCFRKVVICKLAREKVTTLNKSYRFLDICLCFVQNQLKKFRRTYVNPVFIIST